MDDDGWMKSTDPTTGRTFYANKYTRTTQWEAPDGWSDNAGATAAKSSDVHMYPSNTLPEGWEEATDPKSGKTFYINHFERKTTWERPSAMSTPINLIDDYSNLNTLTINKFGSHSKWVDPSKGSRYGSSRINTGMNNSDHSFGKADLEPPLLEFSTVQVPDSLRPACPSCNSVFTTLKRRHHCRLCGDIYCDGCSAGRAVLPLEGEEFNRSVRVCDLCMIDVKRGNYFTWRRYLTPLQLYNPHTQTKSSQDIQDAITIDTVAASLSSLSVDLDAILSNPQNMENQVSISADVLVSAVGRHLTHRKSAEYAIRVLASLVTLGNVVGNDSFALAIYGLTMDKSNAEKIKHVTSNNSMVSMSSEESRLEQLNTKCNILDGILSVLEWGGSNGRTVGAQEQAAKIICYITDPKLVEITLSKATADDDIVDIYSTNGSRPVDVDAAASTEVLLELDVHRAFRAMLDHATSSSSTSLQRWATASLRNLINEDQRRATHLASGSNKYQAFISQLVSTGGITILCSLMTSDDSDTRLHAASALEGIVLATREIEMMLNETGRQHYRVGRGTKSDSEIVNAIISNGGCGYSLTQLLISSDEAVAITGCGFALSLIQPLLSDPKGSSKTLHVCTSLASSGIISEGMNDGLNSYRHAALAFAIGDDDSTSKGVSCLPSFIQIMRSASDQSHPSRPIRLQICAAKCMASVALAVCSVVCAANSGIISKDSPFYQRAYKAMEVMEAERVYEVALNIATSQSLNSLDPSRNTPQAQLKEAAGLILFAVAASSKTSAKYLLLNRALPSMLRIVSDTEILSAPSMIRGEWASRGLCYLEAAAGLLINACKYPALTNDSYSTSSMDPLMEAIDSDTICLVSRVLKAKVNLQKHDSAYSQIRVKIACCYILSVMFEMSSNKRNVIGKCRLYNAIDNCAAFGAANEGIDSRTSRLETTSGRSDLFASTVALLRATLPFAQKVMNENSSEPLPMVDLSEACLLAVGGMCGASPGFFDAGQPNEDVTKAEDLISDDFTRLRHDACKMALDALKMNADGSQLLPAVLVGALGETCILPMLRLSHAIAINEIELRVGIIQTGILYPLSDLLQSSVSAGNLYTITICISIIRHCGSAAKSSESLTESIRTISSMISSDLKSTHTNLSNNARQLQVQCFETLGALASNELLSNVMSAIVLPAIVSSLPLASGLDETIICLALNCVAQLINSPKNAAAVAKGGFVAYLVELAISRSNSASQILSETAAVTLKILHQLSSQGSHVRHSLIANGAVNVLTQLLKIQNISGDETRLACETLSVLITDAFRSSELKEYLVREIASKETFMRRLVATMIAHEQQETSIGMPPVYETKYPGTEFTVAIRLLVQIASLLCSEYGSKGRLLDILLFHDIPDASLAAVYACCSLLRILQNDTYTEGRSMLTVGTFLLEATSLSLKECMPNLNNQAEEIIVSFQVPQLCLIMCQKDDATEAFELFDVLISRFGSKSIGQQLLAEKSSLMALLNIVTVENSNTHAFARFLGDLAKDGFLSDAIAVFGLRSSAIAALTSAIASAENGEGGEGILDEDESGLSRTCIDCLACILKNEKAQIEMKPLEASAVISTIGRSLASAVLHRFFIQASRETTLGIDQSIDRINITLSSEARLLCAAVSSSSAESLEMLNQIGGLDAISLLAHDGNIAAIRALAKTSKIDPRSIITVEAHLSVMNVMCSVEEKLRSNNNHDELREITKHCVGILTLLAENNHTRSAILSAEKSLDAIDVALQIVVAMSKVVREKNDSTEDFGTSADCFNSSLEICGTDVLTPSTWETIVEGDFTLVRAVLSMILAYLPSKSHRSHLANDISINAIIALFQEDSAICIDVQFGAVELIESFTKYSLCEHAHIASSLVSVIGQQTEVLQNTREVQRLFMSKKIASSAASGLQNLFTAINDDLKVKAIAVSSDLFVYIVDSLFVGPKSKRLAVSLEDGILVSRLTSFFLLAIGSAEFRQVLLSIRHLSSMLRFIMMTSGIDSSIVLASNEGSYYLDSAMELCLVSLSYMTNESFQSQMERPLSMLIEDVEPSPGAFIHSLEHLSSEKSFGGALRVVGMKLLSDIRSPC